MDRSNSLGSASLIQTRDQTLPGGVEYCLMCEQADKAWDFSKEELQEYFHDDCPRCVQESNEDICEWCKHIRLGHLVLHVLPRFRFSLRQQELKSGIGKMESLKDRANICRLCHMFLRGLLLDDQPDRSDLVLFYVRMGRADLELENDFSLSPNQRGWPEQLDYVGFSRNPNEIDLALPQRPGITVDWDRVSTWVQTCCMQHDNNSIQGDKSGLPADFRVIDVFSGCVTKAPVNCKYACLSYVWGERNKADLEARADNISVLAKEGYLFQHPLPLTITDAMIACQRLEISYLWVDRLCILQDEGSREERAVQLNAMGDIYGQSLVTLVALAGESANHGLPGVYSIGRDPALSISTQGVYLIRKHESYTALVNRSRWITRGWTFQEALLSPRLLLFSDSGVFFECCHDSVVKDEDSILRKKYWYIPASSPSGSGLTPPESKKTRFSMPSYFFLLGQYTERALSNESDILNALLGILNTNYGSGHYFGLPFCDFDRAVLWWPSNGKYLHRHTQDGNVFPSWSWVSMKGRMNVFATGRDRHEDESRLDPYDDDFLPLAIWAIPTGLSGSESLQIIQSDQFNEPEWNVKRVNYGSVDFHELIIDAIAVMIAWKSRCYPGTLPDKFRGELTWEQYKQEITSSWSSPRSMFDDAFERSENSTDQKKRFTQPYMDMALQPGRILVYNQFLRLHIAPRPSGKWSFGYYGHYILQNSHGRIVGWLPSEWISDEESTQATDPYNKDPFNVVALSLSVNQYTCWKLEAEGFDEESVGLFDSKNEPLNDLRRMGMSNSDTTRRETYAVLVNLMVLRTENGISRRVGIARAHLRSWVKEGPEFGTFVIE